MPVDEPIVTEVHIESVVEITKDEPTFSTAPSVPESEVQFVDEVKISTVDLTEDEPPTEKQPEVVYEYEQVSGFNTVQFLNTYFRPKLKPLIPIKVRPH